MAFQLPRVQSDLCPLGTFVSARLYKYMAGERVCHLGYYAFICVSSKSAMQTRCSRIVDGTAFVLGSFEMSTRPTLDLFGINSFVDQFI